MNLKIFISSKYWTCFSVKLMEYMHSNIYGKIMMKTADYIVKNFPQKCLENIEYFCNSQKKKYIY